MLVLINMTLSSCYKDCLPLYWELAIGTERVLLKIKTETSWLTSATELLTPSIIAFVGLLGSVAMGAAEQAVNNKASNEIEAVMTSHIEKKLWNFVVAGFILSSLQE